jgi:hypothetical protein
MRFFYYIGQSTHPVTPQSPFWEAPLPLCPTSAGGDHRHGITTGEYFSTARNFLSRGCFQPLLQAVRTLYPVDANPEFPEAVRIFLVKHGEFYHPSRIQVQVGEEAYDLVLNVAVSDAGMALVEREYQILKSFERSRPYGFLPRVFEYGEEKTSKTSPLRMFLGEWFKGFHEFHLSVKSESNNPGIVVWDDVAGDYFLDDLQTRTAYERISKILTLYYNPMTFEQIGSWHHAAGDFILSVTAGRIDLRLITIRRYAPMMNGSSSDPAELLDGLLLFLLILSIRMRVDRFDGTGDYAWAPDTAVTATVMGFAEGLVQQAAKDEIPFELINGFYRYLSSFSYSDLLEWASLAVDRLYPPGSEAAVIKVHLGDHIKTLKQAIEYGLWR